MKSTFFPSLILLLLLPLTIITNAQQNQNTTCEQYFFVQNCTTCQKSLYTYLPPYNVELPNKCATKFIMERYTRDSDDDDDDDYYGRDRHNPIDPFISPNELTKFCTDLETNACDQNTALQTYAKIDFDCSKELDNIFRYYNDTNTPPLVNLTDEDIYTGKLSLRAMKTYYFGIPENYFYCTKSETGGNNYFIIDFIVYIN